MKVVLPDRYKELLKEIDRLVEELGKRYPVVAQLTQVGYCFEQSEFFVTITLTGAEHAERIIRSVALDLLPEDRKLLAQLVKIFESCLG
jgi:DNA-binding protein YbaB